MREQLLYLRDVLGVQGLIRPLGQVSAESVRPLVVLLKETWSPEAKALVEKILSATGLEKVITSFETMPCKNLLIFDSAEATGKTIEVSTVIWNLGPLTNLMVGPAVEIQNAKREVWTLLKQLKAEVGL